MVSFSWLFVFWLQSRQGGKEMMGNRQKLKTGAEYDFIFSRRLYCYMANNNKLKKWIKRQLSKRRRRENKKIEELKNGNT
jgi:hypothetical protein